MSKSFSPDSSKLNNFNPIDDNPIYKSTEKPQFPKPSTKPITPLIASGRQWPIPQGRILQAGSDFLGRREPARTVDFRHAGVDINRSDWTPSTDDLRTVYSPESGKVVKAEIDSLDSYGAFLVVIAGDSGVFHLLAHLSRSPDEIFIVKGQRVTQGQAIGKYTTMLASPHLHWEVRPALSWHGETIPGTKQRLTSANKWRWCYDPIRWLRSGELLQGQFVDLYRLRNENYPIMLKEGTQGGSLKVVVQTTRPYEETLATGKETGNSSLLVLGLLGISGYFLLRGKK